MKLGRCDLEPVGYPYTSKVTARSWMGCCRLVKMALNTVLEAAQANHKLIFIERAAFHTTLNNTVKVHKRDASFPFPLKLERSVSYCS